MTVNSKGTSKRLDIAFTYNGNDAGTLWEAYWFMENGKLYKSGTYSGLTHFGSLRDKPIVDDFYKAIKEHIRDYRGEIMVTKKELLTTPPPNPVEKAKEGCEACDLRHQQLRRKKKILG